MSHHRKSILLITVLLAILLISCQAFSSLSPSPTAVPTSTPTTAPSTAPTTAPEDIPNGYGIGDPYFPKLGNPGYDVQNYAIALDVDPESGEISGKTTIEAVAAADLSSFNLDFQGFDIEGLTVNGGEADFTRDDRELIITPGAPLQAGDEFTVEVTYRGVPQPSYFDALDFKMGWLQGTSKAINVLSEPNGASSWYPVNDHPLDKATYRFDVTVPKPWVVGATGNLIETNTEGDKMRFAWEMNKPMASYLASVNIDHYMLQESMGPDGIKIRNYVSDDVDPMLTRNLDALPEMIEYFSGLFGPYPFDAYGVLVCDETVIPCQDGSLSLEAQSLSIHSPSEFMLSETVLAHELAHQWFGDSVSLERWQDIWLKEGFATYASWLWESREYDIDSLSAWVGDQKNFFPPDDKIGEPPPDELYDWESYDGGAMVLHALRLQVGDDAFFDILRSYHERYKYGNAGTEEFIAVAEEVSGQELSAFFDSWLMQADLPEFPNR